MYPEAKKSSIHVRRHVRNRPDLFALLFQTFPHPWTFSPRAAPRSNLHWTSTQGPGTVPCTTRTFSVRTCCTNAIEFPNLTVYWSGIEQSCEWQFISPDVRYVRDKRRGAGETRGGGCIPGKKKRSIHVRSPWVVCTVVPKISRGSRTLMSKMSSKVPVLSRVLHRRTISVLHRCHRISKCHKVRTYWNGIEKHCHGVS